ncbi:uncharacterized protein LOC130653852 [Hydractinia symbiolongicarpus]|uniref:uncharacterized protein LOC130653852 n=1 Tax=Hydractinia symbiolongicarpus TaxID=13093 RepID=UPI00254ACB35|nr:uncharacterized protein LOC130653852 [Hydractinia symbiolongicarpus]
MADLFDVFNKICNALFPQLTIAASKDYQHESNFFFPPINTTTPHLIYNVPNITFAAARVQVNITAEILGVKTSAAPYNFYVKPKDPSPPDLVKTVFTNDTNNVTIVTLTSSSDENGPISYYEVVISTTRKINLPNQLANKAESELKYLDYFLAATVKADDLTTDGIKFIFVEGKEDVYGLNARISTTGKYYLYSRAVINGNDITKYGFNNINYFSNLSQGILIDMKVIPKHVEPTVSSSIGLIAGVAAAGDAVIIVFVIVILFMRRRRKTLKNSCNKRVSSTSIEMKGHNDLKSHETVYKDD